MVTAKPAFNEFGEEALRQRILSYAIPQLPANNFENIADMQEIYNMCMQRRQEDRPSVREILSLKPLREQAKRMRINLGASARLEARTIQ